MNKVVIKRLKKDICLMLGNELEIDTNQNILQLGITSLQIMKLANKWRKEGADVSFVKLISEPYLEKWSSYFDSENSDSSGIIVERKLEENVEFDLTDVQYAYWVGRNSYQTLGNLGCHGYLEIDGYDVEPLQLEKAWNMLRESHPMLRAVFKDTGKQLIKPYRYEKIKIYNFRNIEDSQVNSKLLQIRNKLSHRLLDISSGQVAEVSISLIPGNKTRIHFDIDLLVADVQSFQIILRDLANAYINNEAPKVDRQWSFASYLENEKNSNKKKFEDSKEYWHERIPSLPLGPELPLKASPKGIKYPHFCRKKFYLPKEKWSNLKRKAAKSNATVAMVLLTAYVMILERWSSTKKFSINIPFFNRNDSVPNVDNVVADFTNLILLPVSDISNKSFAENLYNIQNEFRECANYAAFSGVQVQREIAKYRGDIEATIPIVFSCNLGNPLTTVEFKKAFGNINYMISQTPNIWLDFQMFDDENQLLLVWDYVKELFRESVINDMFDSYCALLSKLADCGSDWNRPIDVLPKKQLITREKYNIIDPHMENGLLHYGFFSYAEKNPQKIAVINSDNGLEYTYAEVSDMALRIATFLRKFDVDNDTAVAVIMKRGVEQIATILGILATGAYYIPISHDQPLERNKIILDKANVACVVTSNDSDEHIKMFTGIKKIYFEDAIKSEKSYNISRISSESLAYIIFTSGSSGEPKGVEITHCSAWNTIKDINDRFSINCNDRVLNVSAYTFDLSVYDFFGLLSVGGTVVTISDDNKRDPDKWINFIQRYNVTIWNSVPILMDMLVEGNKIDRKTISSLRLSLLSGDWIPCALPQKIKNMAPNCKIISLGGATEGSIWSNFYEVELPIPLEWKSIPYGIPLKNQKYKIIDEFGRDCPNWVQGELCIGGIGIARGYIGEPILTKEKFVVIENERWYKTGDYGVFWDDGLIEFQGRKDYQVKIRGHRIELGEIENSIRKYPAVSDAIVLVGDNISKNKYLTAYVTLKYNEKDILENLKFQLKNSLPEYMLPQHYEIVDKFPITRNGKVDRNKLKEKIVFIEDTDVQESLKTDTQIKLAAIWKNILNREIYANDNFFSVGGDSLLATQLAVLIEKEFSIRISMKSIFAKAILCEQAAYLDYELQNNRCNSDGDDIFSIKDGQEDRYEPFPLSDIQRAYIVGKNISADLSEISTHYYFELETENYLELNMLEEAFNILIIRHDMMRAVVCENMKDQKVLEKVPYYTLESSALDDKSYGEELRKIRETLCHRKFNYEIWPSFDVKVSYYLGKTRLHLCFSNVFFDGWSIFLVINEWQKLYKNIRADLSELSVSYRDYIIQMEKIKKSDLYTKDMEYWNKELESMPGAPELPSKSNCNTGKCNTKHVMRRISKKYWRNIKERLDRFNITPAAFLISVYAEVLAKWSRTQRFTLNITRFNRLPLHDQIQEIVGDFTSLIMLAVDCTKGNSFLDRCQNIQTKLREGMEHPYVCGVEVQRQYSSKVKQKDGIAMPIVFTSGLGIEVNNEEENLFGNVIFSMSETSQVWIDHQVAEQKGELELHWDCADNIFPDNMIVDMINAYQKVLIQLSENSELWLSSINSLISVTLPMGINNTNEEITRTTLVEMFINQVQQSPKNIAIRCEKGMYTYGELFNQAFALKKEIEKTMINPQEPIGIYMEKGWEQIAAAIGIMMNRNIFVPLDTTNPIERTKKILTDCGISLIFTQPHLQNKLNMIDEKIIVVKWYMDEVSIESFNNECLPDDISYIIYTSGSTGVPKGVAIKHDSVSNTIIDVNQKFKVKENDVTFYLSNFHFDLSIYDIFGMLSVGGGIAIPSANEQKEPMAWCKILSEMKVTIWNSVPAFMEMLISYLNGKNISNSLRLVLLSGDWIPVKLPNRIHDTFKQVTIVGLGGATEASIWSNYFIIDKVDDTWPSVPYGKPLSNQRYYILNELYEQCPIGVTGKLFIAGRGLAKEYWNDIEKTEDKFIYHSGLEERLYDTGDYGKYAADGNIIFQGRLDNQVKLNGYRIEIGEIESALNTIPFVKESAACVVGDNQCNESKRLAAVVVPEAYNSNMLNIVSNYSDMNIGDVTKQICTLVKQCELNSETEDLIQYQVFSILNPILQDLKDKSVLPEYQNLVSSWKKYIKAFEKGTNYICYEKMGTYVTVFGKIYKNISRIVEVVTGKISIVDLVQRSSFVTPEELSLCNPLDNSIRSVLKTVFTNLLAMDEQEYPKVLEIGNRTNRTLVDILGTTLGMDYTFADESEQFLKNCISSDEKDVITKKIYNLNGTINTFDSHCYDIILLNNTLHRSRNIEKTLVDLKRSLKPGGLILIAEPLALSPLMLVTIALLEKGYNDYDDERKVKVSPFLNYEQWISLLHKNNFYDVHDILEESNWKFGIFIAKNRCVQAEIDFSMVNDELKKKLPEYMVPTQYLTLESMPLSANGKIDRDAVKRLLMEYKQERRIIKPRNLSEKILLEMWRRILPKEKISVDDNFILVGGDSLKAIQLVNDIKEEFHVDMSLKELYANPTIEELAKVLDDKIDDGVKLEEGMI